LAAREAEAAITIVHLSDLRFGWGHRFGSLAPPSVDDTFEALLAAVCEDLGKLRDGGGDGTVKPDLLVLSGDLTENARPSELRDALLFVDSLARALGLERHRVAVVPGNRDVSADACAAYFSNCRAEERQPEPPYWPKWRPYAGFFRDLYRDHLDATFEEGRPWTLFEVPDLKVTIAGLNSTLAESHEDHRGWVGTEQLRWFSREMEQARHNGWLRIALLHHDLGGAPTRREEILHDAAAFQEVLASQANLVLHGHGHGAGLHWLTPEVPCFATGTPEVDGEAVSRYQVLRILEDRVHRWSRVCEPGRSRWQEEARGSGRLAVRFAQADEAFRGMPEGYAPSAERSADPEPDDLLARVARILHLEEPKAEVERRRVSRPAQDYLHVTLREGGMARSYPVGAVDRTVKPEDLAAFVQGVHRRYQENNSAVISRLVYTGPPVLGALALEAREQKVRLLRLPELERQLMDLVPLVDRQGRRLEEDAQYPESLYVQQRTRFEDAGEPKETGNALALIHGWVGSDEGRFILVLGDPGTGKTFMLRELARKIAADKDRDIVPILIEMRHLNKSRSLEELVGQHFAQEGIDFFPHRFRYLLENGRIALLFDGFDELATQMTYDRAADHLATLRQAAVKAAKVVVTSRRQHFLSEQNLLTGMGEQVEQVAGRRMTILQPFDPAQIAEFVQRRWGDKEEAARRMRLYEEVRILGLARNPRMLGFICDLREEQLRHAGEGNREILKHEVYEMLVDRWLRLETERANPRGGRPGLSYEQRWQALTDVAERIWKAPDHTINIRELSYEVGMVLRTLSGRERDTAAFQVGSGTFLARDEDGNFSFIDTSILEWLVARKAADELREGKSPDILAHGAASDDMLDFFIQLVGTQAAVRWARQMRNDPHPAVSENAQHLLNLVPEEAGRQRNLAGQDLRWQDLSNQDLIEADLSRADLSGVKLLETDLTAATLAGSRLVRADLSRARLRGTDLTGADLTGASLLKADLTGARLEGTVLRYAKLIGAVYDDSALRRCDHYGAALQPRSIQAVAGAALPVAAVAWSGNGEWLAVASGSAVELWETHSWKAVRRLAGARDRIRCVVFARGDRLVAAGSDDGTLHVWDPATGLRLTPVKAHADAVCGLEMQDDGRAVTASLDGTAAVWDLEQGREIARFRGHRGPVRSLSLQGAGGRLATGGEDGTIRRWDAASGRESRALETGGIPLAVGFSPRGGYFVAATDDRRLLVWKLRTQEDPWRAELGGAAQALAFSDDERLLALALDDRTVRLLDLSSKREVACLAGHEGPVRTVAFRPGSRTVLVSGGDDGTLRIWNEGREERQASGFRCGVRRLAFGRDSVSLLSVLGDGTIRNWDLGTGTAVLQRLGADSVWQRSMKVRPELDAYLQKQTPALAVALAPDGASLATGAQDRTVRLWDLESRSQIRSWEEHSREVRSLAYSPDGQLLASASADRTVRLWSSRGATHVLRHREAVTQVAFAPEGRRLASSCMDGAVRLWSLELGRELLVFPGGSPVLAIAFSPDGRRLAGASQDRAVRVWSLEGGREQAVFSGPRAAQAVAFSPDGAVLAAAGEDACVWIWQGDRPVQPLEGHIGAVHELAFSPDGRLLASGSDDNTIRLWDTRSWECLAVLAPLREGWAAMRPTGRFRTSRATGGGFWHVVGLCRFEPGELSAYAPGLVLESGEPLFELAPGREPS
jgi:WD40 repeat protein